MSFNIDWRDLAERAIQTFWQGFAGVFVLPVQFLDVGAWEAAIVGAAMAGASAVKTAVKAAFAAWR